METPADAIHLRIPCARLDDRAAIGGAVSGIAYRMGFDAHACLEIGTVVRELVANIVLHATRGYLELRVHPDYLEVTAVDRGPGISPAAIAASQTSQRGLGAVRRLMHQLEISSPAEGGTLVRTRRLLGRKP